MKNKSHTALQMIAAGHSVETVMNIVGLEPDELLEILNEVLGVGPELEPELGPRKVHIVECVLEVLESEMLGMIEVNVN